MTGDLDRVRWAYPSCDWDTDDWLAVFDRSPETFARLCDGIAGVSRQLLQDDQEATA